MPEGPPQTGQPFSPGGAAPPLFDPLVVKLSRNGQPTSLVGWMGREIQTRHPVNGLPTARLRVSNKKGFLVNTGTEDSPVLRPLRELVDDDDLITISTARENPETDYVLFEGYLAASEYRTGKIFEEWLELTHVVEDLNFQLFPMVRAFHGELRRKYTSDLEPRVGLLAAADCVFNPDGAKNCLKALQSVDIGNGETIKLPLFAHNQAGSVAEEAETQHWTWARVWLYWYYWQLRKEAETPLGFDTAAVNRDDWQVGPADYRIKIKLLPCHESGLNDGRDLIEYIMGEGLDAIDPDPHDTPSSDPLKAALCGKPRSHALQGLEFKRATDWCCARSGLAYAWESGYDTDNSERFWGLRIFAPGTSAIKTFLMPSPAFKTHDKSWAEVRAKANVEAAQISSDYRGLINQVKRIGAPIKYEITIGLVPGWKGPNAAGGNTDWDVNPADTAKINQLLGAIGTQPWIDKYTMKGKSFNAPPNFLTGRLWGLNTWGQWSDASLGAFGYGRPWGLFNPGVYGRVIPGSIPFKRVYDFKSGIYPGDPDVGLGELADGGLLIFRPRPFEACLTARSPGDPLPPLVQVSYNNIDWHNATAGVRVLSGDARVYFECNDLGLDEFDPDTGMSFAEAYIRGKLRVRITAGIRGDMIADTPVVSHEGSLSIRKRGLLEVRQSDLRFEGRDNYFGFSHGNSQFANLGYLEVGRRHDVDSETYGADQFVMRNDRVRHRGFVQVPELVFPSDPAQTEFLVRPGDQIDKIKSEGADDGGHDLSLKANTREPGDFAIVGSVEYSWKQGGGDDGAPAYCTRYALEDVEVLGRKVD